MASKEELIVSMQKMQQSKPTVKTLPDKDFVLPNHSGDHSSGRVTKTPTTDTEIANKKYVDDKYTGDNSSADTAYVPMVLYNTDATPPAASGFPIGTIYVQYTA